MVDLKVLSEFCLARDEKKKELKMTSRLQKLNSNEIEGAKKLLKLLEKTTGLSPTNMRHILEQLEVTREKYRTSIDAAKKALWRMNSIIDAAVKVKTKISEIDGKLRKHRKKQRINKEIYQDLAAIPSDQITPRQFFTSSKAFIKLQMSTKEINKLSRRLEGMEIKYSRMEQKMKKKIAPKEMCTLPLPGPRTRDVCCDTSLFQPVQVLMIDSATQTDLDMELEDCVNALLTELFNNVIISFLKSEQERGDAVLLASDTDSYAILPQSIEGATYTDKVQSITDMAFKGVEGIEQGDSLTSSNKLSASKLEFSFV